MTPPTVPEIKRLPAALLLRPSPPGHAAWLDWRGRHRPLVRWYHQRARLVRDAEIALAAQQVAAAAGRGWPGRPSGPAPEVTTAGQHDSAPGLYDQRDRLVREGYLVGAADSPAPSVMALTALGAGLATCALLALLSREGDVCPSGYWVDGLMGDSSETQPAEPVASCRCRQRIGVGDSQPPPFMSPA
jgi:hypothetical protein